MDLREQIVRALRKVATRPEACADAVMAVVKARLDAKDAENLSYTEARLDDSHRELKRWIVNEVKRAEKAEEAIKRAKALCAELMTVDPADLTRAQRRQLPASIGRAVLAALDQSDNQTKETS